MKISVQSVNFNISQDLVNYIEKKVNNLEKFHDHIIGAEVYLKVQSTSDKENKITEPEVQLEGISAQIVDILDEYIKPAVASDGGNIAFQSYDENSKQVRVILQGACSGCPSSTVTLKNGIETMLKEMLPNQINEVVAING
mgnify:CR=1 FL=1